MAKKGGRQPGAGRPKGSTTKPRLSDFLTKQDVDDLVNKAMEMALKGDTHMLKFCLEQHFGKAVQPLEGDFKGNMSISFDNAFTPETEGNSV